jgi:hypothetical protein
MRQEAIDRCLHLTANNTLAPDSEPALRSIAHRPRKSLTAEGKTGRALSSKSKGLEH